MIVFRPNFEKRDGLVVVVTQDIHTKEVLMVAYTDEAGYRETLETGEAVYFSTSRSRRWKKGEEESGCVLKVKGILIDCDGDAVIYLVEKPASKAICHTGAPNCFWRSTSTQRAEAPKASAEEKLALIDVEVNSDLSLFDDTASCPDCPEK